MPAAASADNRWTRLLRPGVRYHLLTLAPFVVVLAVIPFSLYAHSGEDWGFPFVELLTVAAPGLALFLGVAVLIRLVAALHARTASTLAVALFCLALFLLLAHVYAPIQIEPLDGSEIESAEPALYTVLELVFLAAAALVFVQLQRGRGLAIAAAFSVALVLVALGYAGSLVSADREGLAAAEAGPVPAVPAAGATSSDIKGNVYHIVLDRMQTDGFLAVLEQNGRPNVFDGFELFRNNVSNYVWTLQSAASYFTGTYLDGNDYDEWINGWQKGRGLLPVLLDGGYRVSMYAPIANWKTEYVDRFQHNVKIYEQETGFTNAGFYDLIHIWLASLVPNPLTNEALPLAAELADPVFELLTGRLRPLSGSEGLQQYASVLMLRQLAREEAMRAPKGEYVYAHALLPHGPFILDQDCRYAGPAGKRAEPLRPPRAYLLHARCSLDLVASFLQELKRLGRYDRATIVMHGDTGDWIPFGETRQRRGRILGYPQRSLLSYVQALLMIKRPYAEGPLRVIERPTQLVDLYPTLLDILDLGPSRAGVHGRSIYSKEADEPREVRIAFDPKAPHLQGSNLIEVRIDDPRSLRSSPLTVIGPVADPAARRADIKE
jgi:hypothetical protein